MLTLIRACAYVCVCDIEGKKTYRANHLPDMPEARECSTSVQPN